MRSVRVVYVVVVCFEFIAFSVQSYVRMYVAQILFIECPYYCKALHSLKYIFA